MIGTKIFDFWIVVYSCRIYKSKIKSLPLKYWILILMMPFLSAVIINLVFAANESDKSMMGSYMICVGGLLYLNLSVFNYFESYDKQIRLAALEKISERPAIKSQGKRMKKSRKILRIFRRGRKIGSVLFKNNKNDVAKLTGNTADSCQMMFASGSERLIVFR